MAMLTARADKFWRSLVWVGGVLGAACAWADVSLPHWYGDHMVLQRERPLHINGRAQPGENVQVELDTRTLQGTADSLGRWDLEFPAQAAGGPHRLTIRGPHNSVSFEDVMMGDVWIASGQSNMEWTLAQAQGGPLEASKAHRPGLRHMTVQHAMSFTPATDIAPTPWKVSGQNAAGDFSAVGYYFGRRLNSELGVPIGIVLSAWGGSQIESWMSAQALVEGSFLAQQEIPEDAQQVRERYRVRMQDLLLSWQGQDQGSSSDWMRPEWNDRRWPTLKVPGYWEEQGLPELDGAVWFRREVHLSARQAHGAAVLHLGMIDDCDETWVNGQAVGAVCGWDTNRAYALPAGLLKPGKNLIAVRVNDTGGGGGFHGDPGAVQLRTGAGRIALHGAWKAQIERVSDKMQLGPNDAPSLLFNAMMHPLKSMSVRGFIWYQGESNVPRAQQYASLLPSLIRDWRTQWRDSTLPFYFVQLASFLPLEKNNLQGSPWAELRDAQRQALRVAHTGMAVTTDVGDADSIHPLRKEPVGDRLALLALKEHYGRTDVVAQGPQYESAQVFGPTIEIRFTELGGGLAVRGKAQRLQGFSIAGANRHFVPALARIRADKVIVSAPGLAHPRAVRYGWVDNPQEGNLMNRAGLPASPFRSDQWPLLSDGLRYKP